MTSKTSKLKAEIRSCLVVWRCHSCRMDLIKVPDNVKTCPFCGTTSNLHGLFSIDYETLYELLETV